MAGARQRDTGDDVLIIDDDETVREVAARYLERLGFAALTSASGPAGLLVAEGQGGRLAAVLLDVTLPSMTGIEVARRLRERWPSLPIVMMSGYDEADIRRAMTGWDAMAFMQKPFRLGDLRAHLGALGLLGAEGT
jgi:DNA-binding response OmpR family regulator